MGDTQLIQRELKEIKKELSDIKKNMLDKDMLLEQEDYDSLAKTAKEKKSKKLISIKEIEKELGIDLNV